MTQEAMSGEITGPAKRFDEFTLSPQVLESLELMGLTTVTPIQEKILGPIIEGKDVVAKAETGTGKTIGFGAPIAGRVDTARVAVQALVLTPTRELAQQVAGVMAELGSRRNLGVALVVGGVHASEQIERLRSGSQVVVGTPGRVLDFLKERILSLAWCETVVLDEADRMLDMGFIDDVGQILARVPEERQTLLLSATLPAEIRKLLREYMRDPEIHSTAEGLATVRDIRQLYVRVEFPDKFHELRRILDGNPDETAIIFCNTRRQAIDLDRMMWGHGYSAGALHGDQDQDTRFKILESFRAGTIRVLVATDVASRGLDIDGVHRVINYEVPDESEAYVHRIGRTGRANRAGEAVTLVARKELRQWRNIVKETSFAITQVRHAAVAAESDAEERDREAPPRRRRRRRRRSGAGKGASSVAPKDAAPADPEARPEGERAAANGAADTRSRGRRPPRGEGASENRTPRRRRGGQRSRPAEGSSGTRGPRNPRGSEPRRAPSEPPRGGEPVATPEARRPVPRPPPPTKRSLDALDDDFVKTDYFDVDREVVRRSVPTKAERRPRGRGGRGRGGGQPPAGEAAGGGAGTPERVSGSEGRSSSRQSESSETSRKRSGSSRRRRRRGGRSSQSS